MSDMVGSCLKWLGSSASSPFFSCTFVAAVLPWNSKVRHRRRTPRSGSRKYARQSKEPKSGYPRPTVAQGAEEQCSHSTIPTEEPDVWPTSPVL